MGADLAETTLERPAGGEEDAAYAAAFERLLLVQDAAGLGVWDWNPATGAAWWSPRHFQLLGADPRVERPGHQAFLRCVHPGDRASAAEAFAAALAGAAPLDLEVRLRDERWLALRGQSYRDKEGRPVRMLGMSLDVTRRREAEDRQRVLMAEVDHRAKNLLALVKSVLRITKAPSVEDFAAAVEGRIDAIARANALVSQRRPTGAPLRRILEEELQPFRAEGGTNVRLHGPAVEIVPDGLQAVTMVVHELATNASKYGALSVPGGLLDVRWAWFPDGDIELFWTETGRPLADVPTRRGVGSMVMEQCVKRQLGGEMKRDWRPEGLRVVMRIPGSRLAWR